MVVRRRVDARGRLEAEPFEHRITKDGSVRISYGGKVVTTVAGERARHLVNGLATADDRAVQLLLAKATGNFKRGNERQR